MPPVYIEYHVFQDLNLGTNQTAKLEVIEGIRNGTRYIVKQEQIEYTLAVDEFNNLIVVPIR